MEERGVQAPALVRRNLIASPRTRLRAEAPAVLQVTGGWLPLTGSTRVMVALGPAGTPAWTHRSCAVTAVVWYGTEYQVAPMLALAPATVSPQVALGIRRRRTCWAGLWEPTTMAEEVPATKLLF